MSEPKWYYYAHGKQGPFSQTAMQEKFNTGELKKETLINRDGVQGWFPAYDYEVFFPGFQRRRRKKYLFQAEEASIGRRAAAFMIDVLVLLALVIGTSYLFGVAYDALIGPPPEWAIFAASIVGVIAAWLYFAAMESSHYQATLGKLLVGIRVTSPTGARISFTQAAARAMGKVISTVLFGVGYVLAIFTRDRLSLHDMLSESRVVKRRHEA